MTIVNESNAAAATAVLPPPDGIQKARQPAAVERNDDVSSAPEEDSQSEIPGDPRPPHALQPPTKDEY